MIDAPHLYARLAIPIMARMDRSGRQAVRFAAWARWLRSRRRGRAGLTPEILHVHDWQAGLALAYLEYRDGRRPGTVMTIHNLAFQGRVPARLLGTLGLPQEAYSIDGIEYLRRGRHAEGWAVLCRPDHHRVTHLCRRDCSPEGGMGSTACCHTGRSAAGILNGIDTRCGIVRRSADRRNTSVSRLAARGANKRSLQAWFELEARPDRLLFGVVSRLTWQKGIDLVLSDTRCAAGGERLLVVSAPARRLSKPGSPPPPPRIRGASVRHRL